MSEGLKEVLLALITAGGTVFATFATIYLEYLRRKAVTAATAATDAKQEAANTKSLINGRLDELLASERAKAYGEGFTAGTAKVMNAVAESPKVSMDAQGVAEAVSSALAAKVSGK